MATHSKTTTTTLLMLAFPFVLIAVVFCCSVLPAEASNQISHMQRQTELQRVTQQRHDGDFNSQIGIRNAKMILDSSSSQIPLGRNMPTDDVSQNVGEIARDESDRRDGRNLKNTKAWLDRYKEMLTRWDRNDNGAYTSNTNIGQSVSSTNLDIPPVIPTVRKRYVIPDSGSSSASYLIGGGDKYPSPAKGRNNGNLEDTLPDHLIIQGIQRLMTSTTTKRTTAAYYRRSTSALRQKTTTPTVKDTSRRTKATSPRLIILTTTQSKHLIYI